MLVKAEATPETCRSAMERIWPKDLHDTAWRVIVQESGGDASRHNWNPATGDDSWGCFQANRYGGLAATRPSAEWLVNADNNVRWAYQMYSWRGWKPWYNTAVKLRLLGE